MNIRRSFTSFSIVMFLLGGAKAAEVVITVTGTLNGGNDYLEIFGTDKAIPKDTPFKLVFTFADTKGSAIRTRCPNSGSGISGIGKTSPGIAILTIGDVSYVFGRKADARSSVWRSVPSACGNGQITIEVSEGRDSAVKISIHPNTGKPLTQDADWRSPLSLATFSAPNSNNGFVITRAGVYGLMTASSLSVESVTVGPKKEDAPDEK